MPIGVSMMWAQSVPWRGARSHYLHLPAHVAEVVVMRPHVAGRQRCVSFWQIGRCGHRSGGLQATNRGHSARHFWFK